MQPQPCFSLGSGASVVLIFRGGVSWICVVILTVMPSMHAVTCIIVACDTTCILTIVSCAFCTAGA